MGRANSRARTEEAASADNAEPPKTAADVLLLKESIAYAVRETHRLFLQPLQVELSRHGITAGQWYFLRVLWEQQGLSQSELSDRVGLATPSTVMALNKLEKASLIVRKPHPNDKRKHLIYLTPHGLRLKVQLMHVAKEVHDQAVAGVSDSQMKSFRRILATIRANLIRMGAS